MPHHPLPRDFLTDARLDNVPNTDTTSVIGISEGVGTAESTLWDENIIYTFPAAATVMTVSSSSADDAAGGTGANYVYIEYLDSNYVSQTLTLALNGTTGVSTVVSIFRINLFRVVLSGSGKINAGNIFLGTGAITSGKPAVVYGRISTGDGAAQNGVYTIPAGYSGLIMSISATSTSTKSVIVRIKVDVYGTNTLAKVLQYNLFNSAISVSTGAGRPLPAKSDIRFDGITTTGTANATIGITLLLIRSSEASLHT